MDGHMGWKDDRYAMEWAFLVVYQMFFEMDIVSFLYLYDLSDGMALFLGVAEWKAGGYGSPLASFLP